LLNVNTIRLDAYEFTTKTQNLVVIAYYEFSILVSKSDMFFLTVLNRFHDNVIQTKSVTLDIMITVYVRTVAASTSYLSLI